MLLLAAVLWTAGGGARAGAVGVDGVPVPLPAADRWCADPRQPALAGTWVIACGRDGKVDRALDLETGVEHPLPAPLSSPGVADGFLLSVDQDPGGVRLGATGPVDAGIPAVRTDAVAPPATDGELGAMLTEDAVELWQLSTRSRRSHAARPLGWYPPAVAVTPDGKRTVAWVEDGGRDGADVRALDPDARPLADRALAAGPGDQRHVVASGQWLAWVEPGAVVVLDTATGQRTRHAAETGFLSAPSLWRDVACWEERPAHRTDAAGTGIDLRCSDGVALVRPGHQTRPSRHGRWLLFQDEGEPWVLRLPQAEPAADPDLPAEEADRGD